MAELEWTNKKISNVTTYFDLERTLKNLAIKETDSLIVHTSLSSFGFIPGGEQTIVQLLKSTTPKGNIVMPAQTADLYDPAEWEFPPATESAIKIIRESMPVFTKETPIHFIGKTPEYFRSSPDTKRSTHPLYSLSAWGTDAEDICSGQTLNMPFGLNSPLSKLYDMDGKILFLGTDYETCTALHFAESTINRQTIIERAPVSYVNGKTVWQEFETVELDRYDDFNKLGEQFEESHSGEWQEEHLHGTSIKVIRMRALIDFAREYFQHKDISSN